jgi:hypothetical protein
MSEENPATKTMEKSEWMSCSLVTPAGRLAYNRRQTKINDLMRPVLELVEEGTKAPADLYSRFPKEDEDLVREAMWRLLDYGFVKITEDRNIAIMPK